MEDFGGLKEGAGGPVGSCEPGCNLRPTVSMHTCTVVAIRHIFLSSKVWCCLVVRLENGCETGGKLFIID